MKNIMSFLTLAIVVSFFSTIPAKANSENFTSKLRLNDVKGVIKLAPIVLTEEQRKANLQGKAVIKVKVNESGKVIEANMIEGEPLLKEACEKAALASIFKPRTSKGKKIKFFAILTYTISN